MAEKLVSIVIVTRNRKKIVFDCLKTIYRQDYPKYEIILVDNGSTDGTAEYIRKKYPKVKISASLKNLGLNGGKNLGQSRAHGEYILFLDSDTLVDKDFLKNLVKLAETDPRIGVVCPKMYYHDHKDMIWYAGVRMNLITSQTANIGSNEKDRGQYGQVRETLFAPTAYLVRRKVAEELGGHDERLFMTYGDTDFGFRAREAGYRVVFCPWAKLWHRLGQEENLKTIRGLGFNLPMRAYYFARNRVIFMKRHSRPWPYLLIFFTVFFPAATVHMVYATIKYGGGWLYLKPYLSGTLDGIIYFFTGKVENKWQ